MTKPDRVTQSERPPNSAGQGNPIGVKESQVKVKESETHHSHCKKLKSNTKLTTITYRLRTWYRACRPHAYCFRLCESLWLLLSRFSEPHFPGVLHPLWDLQYYLPHFCGVPVSPSGGPRWKPAIKTLNSIKIQTLHQTLLTKKRK